MLSNHDPEGFRVPRARRCSTRMPAHRQPDAGPIFLCRHAWHFFGALALGHCSLRDGTPLSDPARPRFGSRTLFLASILICLCSSGYLWPHADE